MKLTNKVRLRPDVRSVHCEAKEKEGNEPASQLVSKVSLVLKTLLD